ncbi:MlaC/ttg2D family ABC transporter substrate-binding protein [Legionella bononiensis]|uniref:ABC transporter substrate-binding protein n=1 Tax=Legionella bononiensis TaxID=2793102 RepID=A0ABS1W864_9GAMM|nr:ABC transporter substrate-binding protein [Legionella bononiensis]MBL7479934.1 ABC transporter substrate-binding protein [Legionella bononiensis]MBL7525551.1 ABC transporter substrate-binding protein [Legionella bononiensis]MBL7561735.1 ABC transporter substrate-binding protein [Legionella bononiensis]
MRVLKTILLVACMSLSQMMAAQTSPVPMLERAANDIIATLKENKSSLKSNPSIIYKAVETYLLPNVDVAGMSRSVLGRQAWNKASPSERLEFSKAFTRLVIRTYSSPLAQYSDETIQFLPLRGSLDSRFIRVNSVIVRSKGQNIPLSYSLVSKNGYWKIYDISVEGVSLLQSFRSQFAQALQHSSINEVIAEMQKKQVKKAS